MTLADVSNVAQIIGAAAVVASLLFVGFQLHLNTRQLRRGEGNASMTQASAIRQLLIGNRETAQMIVTGIAGAPLDAVDQVRLNTFFSEVIYLLIHVWEREREGLVPLGELGRVVSALADTIASRPGRLWWRATRSSFNSSFVTEFEALLPAMKQLDTSSATTSKTAEAAIAPPADAG